MTVGIRQRALRKFIFQKWLLNKPKESSERIKDKESGQGRGVAEGLAAADVLAKLLGAI